MIIDTHCHIDLYQNPIEILKNSVDAEHTIISMTNLPSHFEMGFPHFVSLKRIRLALGMHPLMAEFHRIEFDLFIKNLSKTSYIGEVGLDFSKEGISTKEIQFHTFEAILNAIEGKKKLLSIHSRRAEREVLILLKKYKIKNAIFHWYSGGLNLIDEIAKEGYYFSINPAMVNSVAGRKLIEKIPQSATLTETDGPFIEESNLPLNPGQIETVLSYLSKQWKMSTSDVQKFIFSNFQTLISSLR